MKSKLILGGIAAIAVILGEVWLIAAPRSQQPHMTVPATPPATSTPSEAPVWTTYNDPALGFSIDYPDDGTYTVSPLFQGTLPRSMHNGVEPEPVEGYMVNIGQSFQDLGATNAFRILVTSDPRVLTSMGDGLAVSSAKVINGLLFQKLTETTDLSTSDSYAYAILHNGLYYIFESMIVESPASHGSDNPLFEHMMASLIFR